MRQVSYPATALPSAGLSLPAGYQNEYESSFHSSSTRCMSHGAVRRNASSTNIAT
jgi:hypothetical protein